MSIAIRERLDSEEGFTLIELLVVVIIIGILAAIAIPTFLNQRTKGYDAAAKSDLRNAAIAQESYFTEKNTYAPSKDALVTLGGFKESTAVALTVTTGNTTGYCMWAKHTSGNAYMLNTDSSKIVEGNCTTTTTTTTTP